MTVPFTPDMNFCLWLKTNERGTYHFPLSSSTSSSPAFMDGGTGQPPADHDTEMLESTGSSAAPLISQVAAGIENIPATLSHGGRFIQFSILGNVFEVTSKYKPPIMPIGKGGYGIVWYVQFSIYLFFISVYHKKKRKMILIRKWF